jgi:hypothetical protein
VVKHLHQLTASELDPNLVITKCWPLIVILVTNWLEVNIGNVRRMACGVAVGLHVSVSKRTGSLLFTVNVRKFTVYACKMSISGRHL